MHCRLFKRISKYGENRKIRYQDTEVSFVKRFDYLGNTVEQPIFEHQF